MSANQTQAIVVLTPNFLVQKLKCRIYEQNGNYFQYCLNEKRDKLVFTVLWIYRFGRLFTLTKTANEFLKLIFWERHLKRNCNTDLFSNPIKTRWGLRFSALLLYHRNIWPCLHEQNGIYIWNYWLSKWA